MRAAYRYRLIVGAPRIHPARSRAGSAVLVALLLSAPAASAQDRFTPRVSFNGFGTFGLTYSTERQADFVENFTRSEGPGHSSAVNASLDSRLAGQLTLQVGPRIKAVVQLIAEQTAEGDYAPHAEWANVGYWFTPDFSLRGGRIVMPAFFISDSRKVSFANPWVRPPVELYGMAPVYSLDGVDASYRRRLGEWTGSLNAAAGRTRPDFPEGTLEIDNLWTVNAGLVRSRLTGRIAVAGGRLGREGPAPLFDGLRSFGPEGEALARRYDIDGAHLRFATAAAEYHGGTWFTIAEIGWIDLDSVFGEKLAGYVTGGFSLGAFTPYATYSRAALLSESSVAGLTLTGLPPAAAQAAATLNANLNALLRRPPDQQTLGIGGRWDFASSFALKAQIDLVDLLGTSSGTFISPQPGFEPGGSARVVSVGTVFVF